MNYFFALIFSLLLWLPTLSFAQTYSLELKLDFSSTYPAKVFGYEAIVKVITVKSFDEAVKEAEKMIGTKHKDFIRVKICERNHDRELPARCQKTLRSAVIVGVEISRPSQSPCKMGLSDSKIEECPSSKEEGVKQEGIQ